MVATVFGDVHDIGKSLLITILSNNGYTVHDLGKQVPVNTIVEAAIDIERRRRSACPRCWSARPSRCRCACRSSTGAACTCPVLIGGAAINRAFGRRAASCPTGASYEPGVFYCKDVFEGLTHDGHA